MNGTNIDYEKLRQDRKSFLIHKFQKEAMRRVLGRIKENLEEKEEEIAKRELLNTEWVDPTPDLIEGIFYVNQTNMFLRCCSNRRSPKKDKIVVFDY